MSGIPDGRTCLSDRLEMEFEAPGPSTGVYLQNIISRVDHSTSCCGLVAPLSTVSTPILQIRSPCVLPEPAIRHHSDPLIGAAKFMFLEHVQVLRTCLSGIPDKHPFTLFLQTFGQNAMRMRAVSLHVITSGETVQ